MPALTLLVLGFTPVSLLVRSSAPFPSLPLASTHRAELQRCQTERRHTQALEAAAAQGAWLQQGDRVDTAALSAALR